MKAESPGALVRSILSSRLEAQGFYAQGFIGAHAFNSLLGETGVPAGLRERYGTSETRSLAAVALNYSSGIQTMPDWAKEAAGDSPESTEPRLALARFARANWYAEIDRRLLLAVKATKVEAARLGIEIPGTKAWKRLVNSALPEKALALGAGLGWIGKNTILIASGSRGNSSAVLIGLLLCPIDFGLTESSTGEGKPVPGCGSCRRCVEACPTKALGDQGGFFDRKKCIQHWTHIDEEPPAFIRPFLSDRLYGCDICLEACPYFRPDESASRVLGVLGASIPARALLALSASALKTSLKGTVLDRSWISPKALRRNAALSLEYFDKLRPKAPRGMEDDSNYDD
jgi:epoxyqueuosine reductase